MLPFIPSFQSFVSLRKIIIGKLREVLKLFVAYWKYWDIWKYKNEKRGDMYIVNFVVVIIKAKQEMMKIEMLGI